MQPTKAPHKAGKVDVGVLGVQTHAPSPPSRQRLLIKTSVTQENGKAHNKHMEPPDTDDLWGAPLSLVRSARNPGIRLF